MIYLVREVADELIFYQKHSYKDRWTFILPGDRSPLMKSWELELKANKHPELTHFQKAKKFVDRINEKVCKQLNPKTMHFTEKMIDDSAKKLKIDISKYNMDQVKAGIQVELEHGSKAGKKLDVTHDDLTKTLQIALAHLEEDPEYYVKLEKVENPEKQPEKLIDKLKVGSILKDDHGNFVRITDTREEHAKRAGKRDIVEGIFVDPKNYLKKRNFNDREFSIWKWAMDKYTYIGEASGEIMEADIDTKAIEAEITKSVAENRSSKDVHALFGPYLHAVAMNPELLTDLLNFNETIPAKYRQFFHAYDLDYDQRFLENLKTHVFNLVPDSYKKLSSIKQLSFQADPDDPNLRKLVEPFTGKEELRIMMQGVHFDDYGIVATNAHILLFIDRVKKGKKGTFCVTKKCWDDNVFVSQSFIKNLPEEEQAEVIKSNEKAHDKHLRKGLDGKYPQYQAVVPTNHDFIKVNLHAVREFCHILSKAQLINPTTHQVAFLFREHYFGFNNDFMLDCVETMMKLGYDEAEFAYSSPVRGVLITPVHKHLDAPKLETDFTLIMPVMLNLTGQENQKGFLAFDMETQCAKNVGLEDVCMNPEIRSKKEILAAAELIKHSKKQKEKELLEKAADEEKEIRSELEIAQEEEKLAESHLETAHDALALAQAQELELLELEMNLGGGKKKKSVPAKHPAPRFKKGEKIAILDNPASPENVFKVVGHEDYNESYGWETKIKNVKDGKTVTMYENLLESLDKKREILHELMAPNVGANPSGRWAGAIRIDGWLKDHAYFDNPATVVDWLNKHQKKATHVKLGDPFRIVPVSKKDGTITPIGKEAEEFLKDKNKKKKGKA